MMFKGSTKRWSGFGAVAILTVALSNSSCCSHRAESGRQITETAEHIEAEIRQTVQSEGKQEATLTVERLDTRKTVTEIEIYDTEKPPDPVTGERPLKAKIRRQHGEESHANEKVESNAEGKTEAKEESSGTYDGGRLDETATKATETPGLWERAKVATQIAAVIIILAAAGWIIYKYKKCKKR